MKYDVIVVGGGILGLASAYSLLENKPGIRIAVVEKEKGLAKHQTGNNSGVIHSGLYYKPGSLKANLCRKGYRMLIDFARDEGIDYDICGKIVVATREGELQNLEELSRRGSENGLKGIRKLSSSEISELEPHCVGIRGLHVPQTGIINYKQVSLKLADRIKQAGGEIFLGKQVENIRRISSKSVELSTSDETIACSLLVSCAGLQSDRLALLTNKDLSVRIVPFRGEYFELADSARSLVKNLIYPVPDPAFPFLGVHFTRMIGGGVECGPNAVYSFAREGYRKTDFSFSDTWETLSWPGFRVIARKYWKTGLGEYKRSFSKTAFVRALQRLIPEISGDALKPGGAGVRAQACSREGNLLDDFHIVEAERLIHICNAPSPAATASFSIGETIAGLAIKQLN